MSIFKISEETTDVKRNCRYFFLLSLLLLFCIPLMAADGSASFGLGFGTNHVKASGLGIDNFTGGVCTPVASSSCEATPALNGFFLGIGGDGMPSKRFGIGAEVVFMPAKGNWTSLLQYRQTFYDFNGIYVPFTRNRATIKLMGGIGGARTSSSFENTSCIGSFCSGETISFSTENHFQLHAAAAVEIYITRSMFIRPQYDFRYVTNFKELFGQNTVQGGMVWIGFGTGTK